MTRSADPMSPPPVVPTTEPLPPSPAGAAAPPTHQLHVCPFCGTVSDKPDEPCRLCALENTGATRQATRARIGPWFVLQSRNPASPGMKYSTLLTLIQKGQITFRSVVRG